jgi:hypothetical protein
MNGFPYIKNLSLIIIPLIQIYFQNQK